MLDGSTELLTPKEPSIVSIERPLLCRVQTKPGLETIHKLNDDSDSEVEILRLKSKFQVAQSPEVVCKETIRPVIVYPTPGESKVGASPVVSIIHSLLRLGARKRSNNVLSEINFDAIKLQQIDYLPPRYGGDVIFKFPPLCDHGQNTKPKQLRGMDRRCDGHAWSCTITSNIQNDLRLLIRASFCLGHLRCNNHNSEYLHRDHMTFRVNETEWEGLSEKNV